MSTIGLSSRGGIDARSSFDRLSNIRLPQHPKPQKVYHPQALAFEPGVLSDPPRHGSSL